MSRPTVREHRPRHILALDRRIEPTDLRWLIASEACVRAYRDQRRQRRRGLNALERGPWLLAAFGLACLALALVWRWPA